MQLRELYEGRTVAAEETSSPLQITQLQRGTSELGSLCLCEEETWSSCEEETLL